MSGLRRAGAGAGRLPTAALRKSANAALLLFAAVAARVSLVEARRTAAGPALLSALRQEFRDDLGRLAKVIGRDLSSWLTP
ncbi:MAG TPA: hypothetical protein VMX54_12850 [Vicinamibacteria bacterium]|nr:hypothetical protein [Vicinamibacteria bacterium]